MAKKKWGDRRDARLIRQTDSMHMIMGVIYPNRCDNEAFISVELDLEKVEAYLEKKRLEDTEYKYNVFQFIVTALLKTLTLRPKLNRFYANRNYYEHNDLTAAFVIKKEFSDHSEEGLAKIRAEKTWTINDIHNEIKHQVKFHRSGHTNSTGDAMDLMMKIPRPIAKAFIRFNCFLDRHGWLPKAFTSDDPYYSSVLISNLGSIKMQAGYHHLTNWGTLSVFCTVGEIKKAFSEDENGNIVSKKVLPIGLTIDERVADGYYYSKTVRLIKKMFENPELMEEPLEKEIVIE